MHCHWSLQGVEEGGLDGSRPGHPVHPHGQASEVHGVSAPLRVVPQRLAFIGLSAPCVRRGNLDKTLEQLSLYDGIKLLVDDETLPVGLELILTLLDE